MPYEMLNSMLQSKEKYSCVRVEYDIGEFCSSMTNTGITNDIQ